MVGQFLDYMRSGMYESVGMDLHGVSASGAKQWSIGNLALEQNAKNGLSVIGESAGWKAAGGWGKAGMVGMTGGAMAFTGYNLYQGYQEGGVTGAYDAAIWEIATASAVSHWGYGSSGGRGIGWSKSSIVNQGVKRAGSAIESGGMINIMGRYAGSGIGAMVGSGITGAVGGAIGGALGTPIGMGDVGSRIGSSIAGTAGSFAGAYIGAAPFGAMMRHPLGVAAAGTAVAGAALGYGAYSAVKGVAQMGQRHAQLKRGIDTSGSMAAFMTSGANTMRARAVQAMHKNHLNSRSALGQEASFMHFPQKSYHSRYR